VSSVTYPVAQLYLISNQPPPDNSWGGASQEPISTNQPQDAANSAGRILVTDNGDGAA